MIKYVLSKLDIAGDILAMLKEPAYRIVSEKITEAEQKQMLVDYNNRFKRTLESQTHEEEIDIEGVTVYVYKELFGEIMECLVAKSVSEREEQKEKVREKAYNHGGAVRDKQKEVINQYLDTVWDFIKALTLEKLDSSIRVQLNSIYDEQYKRIGELEDKMGKILSVNQSLIKSNFLVADRFFVHRNEELQQIDDTINRDDIFVLCGMGGVGKTALAKKYALLHSREYKDVILINCSKSITSGIVTQLKVCDSNGENIFGNIKSESVLARKIVQWIMINEKEKILFIFDDVSIKDENLELIFGLKHKKILTSRCDKSQWTCPALNINQIENKEEQRHLFENYLERTLDGEEQEEFNQIVTLVNAHTLTLALIAVQCREADMMLGDVRIALEREGVYTEDTTVFSYSGSKIEKNMYGHIRALWNIAHLSEAEKYVLKGLMMIPVTGIPKSEFKQWMELENYNAVNSLINKSWIQRQGKKNNIISLHAVIAEVIYRELFLKEKDELMSLKESAINAIQNRSEEYSEHMRYLAYVEHMVRFLEGNEEDVDVLLALSMEQEHVYDLESAEQTLDKAKAYLQNMERMQSIQAGHLYNNYGVVYQTKRENEKSIAAYNMAKVLYEKNGDEARKHYGFVLHNLARVYQNDGNHKKTMELENEAEPILEKYWPYHLGEIYDVRAHHYECMAEILCSKLIKLQEAKQYSKAKMLEMQIYHCKLKELRCWETALELKKRYKAKDEDQQMVSLSKCACAKAFLKNKEALYDIQKVYDYYVKSTGENSLYVGRTYSNMCRIYDQLGKKEEAVEYGNKAVKILKETLGEQSLECKNAKSNLKIALR